MDDITRRRLESDRERLADAVSINVDVELDTPALNTEVDKLGVPPGTRYDIGCLLIGVGGGILISHSLTFEQMQAILTAAMSASPSEAYDICTLAGVDDTLFAVAKSIPGHSVELDRAIVKCARMFRNGFAEIIFAIEDAADEDLPGERITEIARDLSRFLLETMYLTTHPNAS